eukprot:6168191-Alexandrium_andersonii.AAC.1
MTAASPTGQLLSLQLVGPCSEVALATFYRRDGTVESSIPSELAGHMAARPGCDLIVAGDWNADVRDEDTQATFQALHLRLAAASGVVEGACDID